MNYVMILYNCFSYIYKDNANLKFLNAKMVIKERKDVVKKFLVLSDLHITKESLKIADGDSISYDKFESNLLKFFYETNSMFDYILLAGDLTDRNTSDGYDRFLTTLNKISERFLNGEKNRIVCCPGNHDLDRGKIQAISKLLSDQDLNGSARNYNSLGRQALLELFSKKDKTEAVFKRLADIHTEKFDKYLTFITNLYKDVSVKIMTKEEKSERLEPGFTVCFDDVAISSLNTAWFCDYPDSRPIDDGNLILGMSYVQKSMSVADKLINRNGKIPRITIQHHPPENLVWAECYGHDNELNTTSYITKNTSLLVTGHVHGLPRTIGYGDGAYIVSNGTSFNTGLTMNFVTFDLNVNNGEVKVVTYSMKKTGAEIDANIEVAPLYKELKYFKAPLIRREKIVN